MEGVCPQDVQGCVRRIERECVAIFLFGSRMRFDVYMAGGKRERERERENVLRCSSNHAVVVNICSFTL